MKLRQRVRIHASPEAVWPYVTNPVLMSTWNPKIVSTDRLSEEPIRLGETFTMIFKMSGKERETQIEVIACDRPTSVTFRHRADAKPDRYADASYTLAYDGQTTRVEEIIDLSRQGIPWPLRALIWFIMTFGKPSEPGKQYLERLKDVVEGKTAAP